MRGKLFGLAPRYNVYLEVAFVNHSQPKPVNSYLFLVSVSIQQPKTKDKFKYHREFLLQHHHVAQLLPVIC
ncbi:hypothetical protein DP117_05255 [Brasilonema sp. UFV-L1]|nr:hypothetical protein [Brasilonema sp. UFV-L1]